MSIASPPDGYETWLDYAVDTMDTRSEYHKRMWNGEDLSREDMRKAARAELQTLRARAAGNK